VQSVLEQTFTDFEFVIIDDGSTDGSTELLRKLADQDPRIVLIARENKGLIVSLNEGIDKARGQLIARMDGDDLCLPERFEQQVAFMREHPEASVVSCRVLCIDAQGWPIGEAHDNTTHQQLEDAMWGRGYGGWLSHPGAMIRTSMVRQVGGYKLEYPHAEDFELWLRLAEVGTLNALPQVLLRYRKHTQSVSAQHSGKQWDSTMKAVRDAAARRGVDPPDPKVYGTVKPLTAADVRYRIAEHATQSGHKLTALKHNAMRLITAPARRSLWQRLGLFKPQG